MPLPLLALAASAGFKTLGDFIGAKRAAAALKQGSTTMANAYGQAAEDAWKLPGYVNPGIAKAYGTAGEDVFNTAYGGAANIEDRAGQAQAGMNTAVTGANQYLDPYTQAGTRSLEQLEALVNQKPFTAADLEFDPSYQFRLQQGTDTVQRTAAGRGGLRSGATLKALTNYGQQAASQEYAAAFERAMRQQQEKRTTLAGLAGYGLNAGAQAGRNLMGGAEYSGNVGMRGTEIAGNWLNEAARYKGNAGINSELAQAGNILNAGNAATQYGIDRSRATAMGQTGQGNIWGPFYQGVGNTMGNLVYDWGASDNGVQGMPGGGTPSPSDLGYDWGSIPQTRGTPGPPPPVYPRWR